MIRYSATSSLPCDTARKSAVLGGAGDGGAVIKTDIDEVDVPASSGMEGQRGSGRDAVHKHEV